MSFYDRVSDLCKERKISRKQMCNAIGLSYNTYNSMVKRQSRNITLDVIESIASFFNVSVDYLLCRTNDPAMYNNYSELEGRTIAADVGGKATNVEETIVAIDVEKEILVREIFGMDLTFSEIQHIRRIVQTFRG